MVDLMWQAVLSYVLITSIKKQSTSINDKVTLLFILVREKNDSMLSNFNTESENTRECLRKSIKILNL